MSIYLIKKAFLTVCWLMVSATCVLAPESLQAADWPLARGNSNATGAISQTFAENYQVRWEYEAPEAIETSPIIADGRVFVSDILGRLSAITLEDGKLIWMKDFETGFLVSASIRVAQSDDTGNETEPSLLVIGDVDGNVYCLDPGTGEEKWRAETGGEIDGSATFYKDSVLVASQDGQLYRLDASTGKQIWVYATEDQIRCSPTIAGDVTFLGGCDGKLHIVNLDTGKAVGVPLPLSGPTGSTVAVRDSRAFLPTMDGTVFSFDWTKPQEIWQHADEERDQEYRNNAAVGSDRIILSSKYRNVDALDLETGKLLWRHTLKRRADASPVIAGDDVWIASTDGRLIRLSLDTGEVRSQEEYRGSFLAAPAFVDDLMIIADDDGIVRCLAPKTP